MENEEVFNALQEAGLCPYEAIAFQNILKKLNLNAEEVLELITDVQTS